MIREGCQKTAVNLASRSQIREPEAACLIFGVHQQVAGLLGSPVHRRGGR